MPDNFLTDLAGLSKPATLLVEKIANAFGRHYDPHQTVRMALAEADAQRILTVSKAETEIEVNELRLRAADRILNEEMTKQANIESITQKAIPHLTDDASPENIQNDWITNFFDKSRIVSDAQMQELWASILAGEVNRTGSFSRRTVNLVADLDKRDAELFTNFCRFIWRIHNNVQPLIFDSQHEIYNQCGIDFGSLSQLETLGLVHFNNLTGFRILESPRRVTVSYSGRQEVLTFPSDSGNEMNVGKALLTQSGLELSRVIRANVVEGFFDYVHDRWVKDSLAPR